jgi:hypothetical protein
MARFSSIDGDTLLRALAAAPGPVGLEALQAGCPGVPRRTLQRRLAELVASGRVLKAGSARACRYRAADPAATPATPPIEGYTPNVSYFLPRTLGSQLQAAEGPLDGILAKAQAIEDPHERAFFLWLGLAWLHASAGGAKGALAEAFDALRDGHRVQPLRDLFVAACGPPVTPKR